MAVIYNKTIYFCSSLRSSRFLFLAETEQASEKAGKQRSTPGVSKKLGRTGEGVSGKGEGVGLASPPPSGPYFLHSLPVSFLSRKFLKTSATQDYFAHI